MTRLPSDTPSLWIVLIVLASLGLGACASTGAVPRPFPMPSGTPPMPNGTPPTAAAPKSPTAADNQALADTALLLRGIAYREGGTNPATGFDCSGFTQYVFGLHGIALPRDVKEQSSIGSVVSPDELAPGDLLFFSTVAPGASHVAIALGGDKFVHAPSSTGVVRVERMSLRYWAERFVGARRVL